ncbi:MAG: thioesterase family protein [Candidatus Omnitrophota bacterium]|nr:thioesterase family protein [Candidatus Omnitrophota bacterium]
MGVCSVDIRVRYQETDKFGIVYYANYYVWFEIARTEFFRSAGLPYAELEKKGIYIVVVSSSCQYKQPAYYDDQITIRSRISSVMNTSFTFEYEVVKGKDLLATGKTVQALVNKDRKPVKIPEDIREVMERRA